MLIRQPRFSCPSCRTLCAGALLFFATAAFVLWQNLQLTVLWDLSYILENATRLALGQRPYRDFPFPYAPLTFVAQTAIIKLFGRHVLLHFVYAACSAGAATVLTWRILLRLLLPSGLPARGLALALAAPLVVVGTGSIFPHPFYDPDCTLAILLALWWLLRLEAQGFPSGKTVACGALLVLPLFVKQNTGLLFLAATVLLLLIPGIGNRRASTRLLAGMALGLALAGALLQTLVGVRNYYYWTVQFAASRRLPGLNALLDVYRDPALVLPYVAFLGGALLLRWAARRPSGSRLTQLARWAAVCLLLEPFLATVWSLWGEDAAADRAEVLLHVWPVVLVAAVLAALWRLTRARSVATWLPLVVLVSAQGAFLSQQLWGSTYALWPMLVISLAVVTLALNEACAPPPSVTAEWRGAASRRALTSFVVLAALSLMVSGAAYSLSHERLSYADLAGAPATPHLTPLRGLALRGAYLGQFEQMTTWVEAHVAREDAILEIPGEDLFYFATGRTPQFPVILMDHTVNPYSADELAALARQRDVRWVIVKRRLQLQEEPIEFRARLLDLLAHDFRLAATLDNYEIYQRKY